MSDILCKWLNEDVRLSRNVDINNFAECFSNGYLIGELLHCYGLQDDFPSFSQSSASEARLNNFSKIEPTMALLEIKFDTNLAKQLMDDQPGKATKLLYQLFIALGKKTKMNLTGVAMETMRPAGPAGLGVIKSDMYKERLKTLVPRQVDLDFDELLSKYNRKQKEQEEKALQSRYEEEERTRKQKQAVRQQGLERCRQMRATQDIAMQKIKEATVKIPKPPGKKKCGKTEKELAKEREVLSVYKNIDSFEKNLRNIRTASPQSSEQIRDIDADIEIFLNESPAKKTQITDYIKPENNDDYVMKIRKRLNEDENARKEREKRRRRVLLEQMKAHEVQQENTREDILVNHLMRQSQMERRIAVQLMHVRHEKEIIKQNRREQERQFTERRLKDFQDALDREAEMCRLAKLEYAEDLKKAQETHEAISEERAIKKYEKHYGICKEIFLDIVDFVCKVGEYRELTERLLPPKVVREWKTLFIHSKPLYDIPISQLTEEDEELILMEESKQTLLDDEDFVEYQNFVGEWDSIDVSEKPSLNNNNILGFILRRLNNILYPPTPPPPEPEFPAFPIKACVLGKYFAGKSFALQQIADTHRIEILDVEELVERALDAWKNQEKIDVDVVQSEKLADESVEENRSVHQLQTPPVEPQPENTDKEHVVASITETAEAPVKEESKTDVLNNTNGVETNADIDSILNECVVAVPSKEMQFTALAKLGEKASLCLQRKQSISDSILVEILVEKIRGIAEGTGWIIDGFPKNIHQAKILEKALTGYSPLPSPHKSATRETKRNKKSKLAHDPIPPPEVKPPKSGLDVVILFDLDDGVVLRRAVGRSYDPNTGEEYHEEFDPPQEGCYTGLQSKTKIKPVVDSANDQEHVQLRLTTFQDTWPKLEKWFNKFDNLVKMDANVPRENTFTQLKLILDETLIKITVPPELEEKTQEVQDDQSIVVSQVDDKVEVDASNAKKNTEGSTEDADIAVATSETELETPSQPTSPKSAKKNTKKAKESLSSKKGASNKTLPPSPCKSGGSKHSATKSDSPCKNDVEEQPDQESEIKIEVPTSPLPGSKEWTYVEQPLDHVFVSVLMQNWEIIEETYVNTCKHVFRNLRIENEIICQYFYDARKRFVEFLKRPDEKQLYVLQWQKEYNSFPDDMRNDEEAKAELHQRIDDLCDRLWDICDVRKEEAESERQVIMSEGWLEDHVGLILNHYISLIQAEIDRFQQTCKMLKDYYIEMERETNPSGSKLISEGLPNFTRVPLVDIPPTIPPSSDITEGADVEVPASQLSISMSATNKNATKTPEPVEDKIIGRIPLISKRTASAEHSPTRADKKKTTPRKEKVSEEKMDSPVPAVDLDDKLLNDAVASAFSVIEIQNNADLAEDDAEQSTRLEKTHDLTKSVSKEKKGKKGEKDRKSPGKSKTQVLQPITPLPIHVSEEEKQKTQILEKMNKEYKAVIACEGCGLKIRVDVIRLYGLQVIKKLKEKADATFVDMDNWLGKRFLEEMNSIDNMTEVMRQAIENETLLQDASVLEDKDFFIDEDLHVFKTPTPTPTPPPKEEASVDVFTCIQLKALCTHFQEVAPSGLLNIKSFVSIMSEIPTASIGLEALPEKWLNVTVEQLEKISSVIAIHDECINWKMFLLLLSKPYPIPTPTDLFDAMEKYTRIDSTDSGYITSDDFEQTPVWLDSSDVDDHSYDRVGNLKKIFFDIFSTQAAKGELLDYKQMLLYFVSNEDPLRGLCTALSLLCGQPLPGDFSLKPPEDIVEEEAENKEREKGEIEEKEGEEEEREEEELNEENKDMISNESDLRVSISHWLQLFNHGESVHGADHRFSFESTSTKSLTKELIVSVYNELDFSEEDVISLRLLYEHPVLRDLIDGCTKYGVKDIQSVFRADVEELTPEPPC